MNLAHRLRILVHQRTDSPGLRTGEVVRHHTSGGQYDRVLAVGFFSRGLPFHWLKMRFTVWMVKLVAFIKARCARMIRRRARPEHALLPIDALPGDAVVIADSAFGGDAQLVKNLSRGFVPEFVGNAQPCGDVTNDLPVRARVSRRIENLLMVNHPAFHVGRRDRKSTRLNSSHGYISYAVLCLKKKK